MPGIGTGRIGTDRMDERSSPHAANGRQNLFQGPEHCALRGDRQRFCRTDASTTASSCATRWSSAAGRTPPPPASTCWSCRRCWWPSRSGCSPPTTLCWGWSSSRPPASCRRSPRWRCSSTACCRSCGFIGASGYGRPILRGIDKFDVPLMLEGAIPAALLALAIEGLFGLIERAVPRRG
jgi:hypothetical protein